MNSIIVFNFEGRVNETTVNLINYEWIWKIATKIMKTLNSNDALILHF